MDKILARLKTKQKRQDQIAVIRNQRRVITANLTELKRT